MTGKSILKFIGVNIILFIVFFVSGFGYVYIEMSLQQYQVRHGLKVGALPQPIFFKAEQAEVLPPGVAFPKAQ